MPYEQVWQRLWSYARVHLHLSDAEFYSLTPRQYGLLCRQHRNGLESTEFLFAQLTSWIANTGFRTTEKPVGIRDFMPSLWPRTAPKSNPQTAKAKPIRMTAKRRAQVASALRGLFPPR